MSLGDKMRYQRPVPEGIAPWQISVDARLMRWQELRAALQLAAGARSVMAGCFCEWSDRVGDFAGDAGYGGQDGGGPGPGGDGPGDGSNPGGWADPNADPRTLNYECVQYDTWQDDGFFTLYLENKPVPSWASGYFDFVGLDIIGPRWIAAKPINWPQSGHVWTGFTGRFGNLSFETSETEYKFFFYTAQNTRAYIYLQPDFANNPSPSPDGIQFRICGAVPPPAQGG